MTHLEALRELCFIPASIDDGDFIGFTIDDLDKWAKKGRIPLIHIPEIAGWVGVKPSDIDDYFIGKDHIEIDWSSK